MARKKEESSKESIADIRAKEKNEKLKLFREKMLASKIEGDYLDHENQNLEAVEVISTGVLSIDRALKVFGFPRGRIIELYGEEGTGKTALSLLAAGKLQKEGGVAALIDMECAYDLSFGSLLGVDNDELQIFRPYCLENAFEKIIEILESGFIDLIIVDSVANLVPKDELEGTMEDNKMGLHARKMAQGLRKITNIVSKTRTCIIFINQTRMKIGVMYGNPETTTGGNALKFYSSMRIRVSGGSSATIKNGDEVVGHRSEVVVKKNKVGPPHGRGEIVLYYKEGIDIYQDTFNVAKEEGIVEGTTWLSYKSDLLTENDGIIKMQGTDKFVNFLKEHPYIACEMRDKVMEKIEKERKEYQKLRDSKKEEEIEIKECNIETEQKI